MNFALKGSRKLWGKGKVLMCYNSYNEYTGGVSINLGCIKTVLGKRISLERVHSGYNLHKVLRHAQQYCLKLHAYVVKCKNTYGMINNVHPGLSTISGCFTL